MCHVNMMTTSSPHKQTAASAPFRQQVFAICKIQNGIKKMLEQKHTKQKKLINTLFGAAIKTTIWFINGTNLNILTSLKERLHVQPDGSLSINHVIRTDMAWYTCAPTNNFHKSPDAKAFLNVTYIPRVQRLPSTTYLALDMKGFLHCPVDSNPPVTHITRPGEGNESRKVTFIRHAQVHYFTAKIQIRQLKKWFKNNSTIDLHNPRQVHMHAVGTSLYFDTTSMEDEGFYMCAPHSNLGQGHISSSMQVLVRGQLIWMG
ncbi:hypothetical protein HELRODRAFT_164297 [Helobdella robusta]|uniref:Ig-like domain-containing protein n=1 Tax=Helobdella robusta TaxID=6412 RepID=T1EV84_HELRO|nr:hypothetical protein HELRODRAFT_164297 [Helobdella robusta]ESN94452.1 hypothetical protein HELRODRAFT_164297 [Helobdella robusta]